MLSIRVSAGRRCRAVSGAGRLVYSGIENFCLLVRRTALDVEATLL